MADLVVEEVRRGAEEEEEEHRGFFKLVLTAMEESGCLKKALPPKALEKGSRA